MRRILISLTLLAGCALTDGVGLPNMSTPSEAAQNRAMVELGVKSDFPAILADIQSGGGASLTRVFDLAGVPEQDRATRAFQLNNDIGLYAQNPGALITTLLVYGQP